MGRPRKIIEGGDAGEIESSADPLILTISELNQLSQEEKTKFRHSGGTVIEDHS